MGSNIAASIVKSSNTSFYYSFLFLPRYQREAIRTVYAFCRTTDDIVDNDRDATVNIHRLKEWREELERALSGTSKLALLNQLASLAKKFNIPVIYFYELLKGIELDIVKNRYETFDELKEYCYYVASTVGLMCLEIFSSRSQKAKKYAINLGIAMQLTNIIRDVAIDARYGRIYLPQEDLLRFGYSEEDLFAHRYTPEFQRLMEYETLRAEEYFRKAQESLPVEDRKAMFAAKIMERIYYHTLQRIKNVRYNVFEAPVSLPRFYQFLIAVKYWLKEKIFSL